MQVCFTFVPLYTKNNLKFFINNGNKYLNSYFNIFNGTDCTVLSIWLIYFRVFFFMILQNQWLATLYITLLRSNMLHVYFNTLQIVTMLIVSVCVSSKFARLRRLGVCLVIYLLQWINRELNYISVKKTHRSWLRDTVEWTKGLHLR